MQTMLPVLIVFFVSSIGLLFITYFHASESVIYQSTTILLGIMLLLLNSQKLFRKQFIKERKMILLFFGNILVQFIILSTGGLYSPFFVLYHLCTILIGFFFNSVFALLFIAFTILNISFHVLFNESIKQMTLNDPITALLYAVSFITIAPLAHLLATHYHGRDSLLEVATNQVKVDEAILADLSELVFVTDLDLTVLSLNDAAERALQRTRSEVLNQPLLESLFIKDKTGAMLTPQTIPVADILEKKTSFLINDVLLPVTALPLRKLTLQIKPIPNIDGTIEQLSFIFSIDTINQNKASYQHIEEAQIKQEAKIEDLKKRLKLQGLTDFEKRLQLIAKAQEDILAVLFIEQQGIESKKTPIDIAMLSKQTVNMKQDFASAFKVPLTFSLVNFGTNDIAPLVTKVFPITPEQFTGPFFTANCDVKYTSLGIQKLLEVALILASKEPSPQTTLSVELEGSSAVLVRITTSSPLLTAQEQTELFVQQYGSLRTKTNLELGSGLEGYLVKTIMHYLNIPLQTTYDSSARQTIFTLRIPK